MKLDKQQILVIGIIGIVVIFITFYSIAVFGGKKDSKVQQKFEAPKIVKNDVKDNYNQRISKALRTEPEKPKNPVLLNPFETKETDTLVTQKSIEENILPKPTKSQKVPTKVSEQTTNQAPKPKPVKQPKTEPTKTSAPEPEKQNVVIEQKPLITKERYSGTTANEIFDNTLSASVYGQQKLYNNSLLKIRLLSPLKLPGGIIIPRNTFVSGVARISNERVKINIKSVTYKNEIYHVNYSVCDANDGLEGIYIEGAAVNDVADKTGSSVTEQAIGIASTGMRVVQNVGQEVKKWTKKKSVTILDEHKLFLIEN